MDREIRSSSLSIGSGSHTARWRQARTSYGRGPPRPRIPLQVVLPFETAEFERTSVAPAGAGWVDRFRACLGRAESVVHASDSSFMGDDELFGYAGRIAMGHALNRAAFLDAPAQQLAVWDQAEGAILAGTAHDVAVWKASGHPTHVIALRPAEQPPEEAGPHSATRQHRCHPLHRSPRVFSVARRAVPSCSSNRSSDHWVRCWTATARPSCGAIPGATPLPPCSPMSSRQRSVRSDSTKLSPVSTWRQSGSHGPRAPYRCARRAGDGDHRSRHS